MKSFQNYFYEAGKLYEFRIKLANVDATDNLIECIKNAVNVFQLESIGKPKNLPIQEHKEFRRLGPCECVVVDIAVKYPTIVDQIRQLVIERAGICAENIWVYTKNQDEYENEIFERIAKQEPVVGTDEMKTEEDGQSLVGSARIENFLKELETRKFTFAADSKESGKTTNDIPQNNVDPVGSRQNKIPSLKGL